MSQPRFTIGQFATAMAVLENGMGRQMSREKIDVWYRCLNDLPLDRLQEACFRQLREGDDWPTIAKLRRFAGEPTVMDRAEKAWEVARAACRRLGGTYSVDFDDPLINATIRALGGWSHFTLQPHDELKWRRRDFINTYRAMINSTVHVSQCAALAGDIDVENGFGSGRLRANRITTGLPAPNVRLVGKLSGKPSAAIESTAKALGVDDGEESTET